jgi:hypothetical protein
MNKTKVYWHDTAKTIIHHEYFAGYKNSDVREAVLHSRSLIDSVTHKVSVIVEFHSAALEIGFLNELRHVSDGLRDNHEISVFVGAGFTGSTVLNLLKRLRLKAAESFYLADTIEEALATIEAYRKTHSR